MIAAQYNVFNAEDSASAMARSSCGDAAGNFARGYGEQGAGKADYNDGSSYGYGDLDSSSSKARLGQHDAVSHNDNYYNNNYNYNYNSMMKMSGFTCPPGLTLSSTSDDDVAPIGDPDAPRRTAYPTSSADVDHQPSRWRSSSTSDEDAARPPRRSAKAAAGGGDDVDEDTRRRLRRMQSNRESARRSRLRKQQHLDELRAQVAQLRVQNSQMLTQFNVTSKQFAQISQENRALRSEALQLSSHLDALLASTSAPSSSSAPPHFC